MLGEQIIADALLLGLDVRPHLLVHGWVTVRYPIGASTITKTYPSTLHAATAHLMRLGYYYDDDGKLTHGGNPNVLS